MFLEQSEPGLFIRLEPVYSMFCQFLLFQGSKFAEIIF